MEFLIEQFGNWSFYLVGGYPRGSFGGLAINIAIALLCLGRLSCRRYISYPSILYIEFIRATPALLLVFWFFFFIPSVLGKNVSLFWSAVISLTVYATAYQAEIIRAGILAVPKGQIEAALSSGMTQLQAILYVILPQAFRIMVPSFVAFFVSLFKETSVVYIIGVVELVQVGIIISQRQPDRMFAAYIFVAGGFWIICFIMSRLARTLEKRFGMYDLSSYRPTVCRPDLSLKPCEADEPAS
jgi:His/Glu/Gln/Arg/opine family amino acid ABC transporter permease subunit